MNRNDLESDEVVQMWCCMLVRGRNDSRGAGPEHVAQVLDNPKYSHTVESLLDAVDAYIEGGCGISG